MLIFSFVFAIILEIEVNMSIIINTIKTKKHINELLTKDEEIWSSINPPFSLKIATRDNKKISAKFVKAYYYDCYEPVRKSMFKNEEKLDKEKEHLVELFANRLFLEKYKEYFLYCLPNGIKGMGLVLASMAQLGAGSMVENEQLSSTLYGVAIITGMIACHYGYKGYKQYMTDSKQSTQITHALVGGEQVYLRNACNQVYVKKNINKKEQQISNEL